MRSEIKDIQMQVTWFKGHDSNHKAINQVTFDIVQHQAKHT